MAGCLAQNASASPQLQFPIDNAAVSSYVSLHLHECTCACMTAVAILRLHSALQAGIQCMLAIEDKDPGKTCRQIMEEQVAFRLMGMGFEAERNNQLVHLHGSSYACKV